MQVPLEWSHRGLDNEQARTLEVLVREQAAKLERHAPDLVSCRVAVEVPQTHQRTGSPYRVRIEVGLPATDELVVSREPGQGDIHEPAETAIRAAFAAMERQIESARQRRRGDVKHHGKSDHKGFKATL